MKRVLIIFFSIILLINIMPFQKIHADSEMKNRYIVKYKESGINRDSFSRASNSVTDVTYSDTPEFELSDNDSNNDNELIGSDIHSLELSDEEYQQLLNSGNIELIEPDSMVAISATDNVINGHDQWGLKAMGGDIANSVNINGNSINIAVLDTGGSQHDDLSIKGGVSFVENVTSYEDDNGHGTQVTGVIASKNNNVGTQGISPQANIYEVKVIDATGIGYYSNIIKGIDWAIANNMDVINMSFCGREYSQLLHESIIRAANQGIIVVAASGNNGQGAETETYPALFPEVVSVGSVNEQFYRSDFSSTGVQLDLMAPGENIYTTGLSNSYVYKSGTSMAAPYVTGAVASLLSYYPNYSASQIKNLLYSTATPLGDSQEYGYGLINIPKALGLSNETIFPEFPLQNEPIGEPNPETGTYGDVGISAIKTGDGQKVMAGNSVSVSVKLGANKATVLVAVFTPDGANKIASASYTNKKQNESVYFTWNTTKALESGTYKIKFYYNDTDAADLFAIHVSPYVSAPVVTKGTVTSSSASISWNSVTNATGYKITCYGKEYTTPSNQVSQVLTGLNSNTQYTVSVKAINSSNLLGDEGTVEVTTLKNLKPNSPSIKAVTPTSNQIKLEWNNSENAISYDIFLDDVYVTNVRNVTAYTFPNLLVDRAYTVGVAAKNDAGTSDITKSLAYTNDDFNTASLITTSKSSAINSTTDIDYYKFIAPSTGTFYFESSATFDLDAELYDSNLEIVNSGSDINSSNSNFYIGQALTANNLYYIAVYSVGDTQGSYTISVTPQTDDITSNKTVSLGTSTAKIDYPEDTDTFKFIPTKNGMYSFSSSGSLDTEATLFNSSLSELASNDDDELESTGGFNVEYSLVAGQTYYLTVGSVSFERGSYTLTIVEGAKALATPAITYWSPLENNIYLEWDIATNSGVQGYKIYRDGVEVGNTIYSSYMDRDLLENHAYIYAIKAYSNTNSSTLSAAVSITSSFKVPTPVSPIIHLSNSNWTNQNITFSITKGEAVEKDRLYYKVGEGDEWTYYTSGNITLSNEGQYKLYAKTVNVYDVESISEAVVKIDRTPPSAPSNINFNFTSTTQGTGSWNSSDNVGVARYNVYSVNSAGTRTLLATTTGNSGSFVFSISGVSLVIQSVDIAGNTAETSRLLSDFVDRTAPTQPGLLTTAPKDGTVSITFINSTDNVGVAYYEVFYSSTTGTPTIVNGNHIEFAGYLYKPGVIIVPMPTYVTIYIRAVDAMKNKSSFASVKIRIPNGT